MALVVRTGAIVSCDTSASQHGATFETLGTVRNAWLLAREGRIAALGARAEVEAHIRLGEAVECLDFRDCVVVPGMVDAHAHPLFAGNREPDFEARLRGEPPPLGMQYTVDRTRDALKNPDHFWDEAVAPRLRSILSHGTTTLETKTGYALHAAGELELLRLIASHAEETGLPRLIATFLGAHAVPPEFPDERAYVEYLIAECLPFARAAGAVYADAFCEPGFFSVAETERYLRAAREAGLRLRVHCDEMVWGGGAAMAVAIGVDAIDHANNLRDEDVRAIAAAHIVTVACPSTIAYLGLERRAPLRALLELGADVALASDFNPGTSPCFNLQTVAYFGRSIFGLSAAEALYGVTIAAARSLRVAAGRLRSGDWADFVALRIAGPEEFGWQFGGNLAAAVFRRGVRAT